jgi:lantibiotic biosynthesis protein
VTGDGGLRSATGAIVAEIADRLRDPAAVIAHTTGGGADVEIDGMTAPLWSAQSLARGYPGVALLYAELGHTDGQYRHVAHRYLELAARQPETNPLAGQLDGLCAVAAALRLAAHHQGDYATLLGRLDEHVITNARRLIALQTVARRAGEPTRPVIIDTLNGLAGLGRYLLGRPNSNAAKALADSLTCLSSLREPVSWHGTQVPGWWYHLTPFLQEAEAGAYRHGCAAFGLSHGLAGPLALLALAWQAGVRVPGQDEAAHAMAQWLVHWRQRDGSGWYWPAQMPLTHYRDRSVDIPEPARVSWCHGSWGPAHALSLAGKAFECPDWTDAAGEVVHAMLARCRTEWKLNDHSLCHGWASVLHQLCRLRWSIPHPDLAVAADEVAGRLVADFDAGAPFGYRYVHPSGEISDLPGLLEGVAGIALALHSYASGHSPASGWDSVLLLS